MYYYLLHNNKLYAQICLQTRDTIVILASCVFIVNGFVPPSFSRERDFVLTFVVALNAILVVPLLLARAWEANFELSVAFYSWVALAPQTCADLRLVGVQITIIHITVTSTTTLTLSSLL